MQSRREIRGFTLIELLVVVAIVGLLAGIGLPSYMGYRATAVDGQMQTALRDARNAMEAYYVENQRTYEGATVADLEGLGYRMTDGVTLELVQLEATRYVVRSCAEGGTTPSFTFDSSEGSTVPTADGC